MPIVCNAAEDVGECCRGAAAATSPRVLSCGALRRALEGREDEDERAHDVQGGDVRQTDASVVAADNREYQTAGRAERFEFSGITWVGVFFDFIGRGKINDVENPLAV